MEILKKLEGINYKYFIKRFTIHSRKATKKGFGWLKEDPYIVLKIKDTGIGIKKSCLLYLTVFYRVSDDTWGFGLGLAICKRITERHNGAISVEVL